MNTIEFEVIQKNKIFDVDVIIDCKRMKGLLDLASVMNLSRLERCRFDLFTCSCGVAGCAGYQETAVMQKEADRVRIEIPDYYPIYGILNFDRKDFEAKIQTLRKLALDLESRGIHHTSLLNVTYSEPHYEDLTSTLNKYYQFFKKEAQRNKDWTVYYKNENDEDDNT